MEAALSWIRDGEPDLISLPASNSIEPMDPSLNMASTHRASLNDLGASLRQLADQSIDALTLAGRWRAQTDLLQALPPRYGEVLENLLQRLESGSLFTEESCSFSQSELHDSLRLWLEKAGNNLAGKNTPG